MASSIFSTVMVAALLLSANAAHSAQLRFEIAADRRDEAVMIELVGEIRPGDAESLWQLIKPHLFPNNVMRTISLNSTGGDVATAMQIGRLLRRLEFDTFVTTTSRCLSSCVFILAAGAHKNVTSNNGVGIHRPYGIVTGSVSLEDATKRYRGMTSQIYAYFDEMNIPRSLPEEMLRIPPEQMKMLSFAELQQFGLAGKDPVAQERDDASNGKRLGLSRQEYLSRRNRALQECHLPLPRGIDANCYDAILSGRR